MSLARRKQQNAVCALSESFVTCSRKPTSPSQVPGSKQRGHLDSFYRRVFSSNATISSNRVFFHGTKRCFSVVLSYCGSEYYNEEGYSSISLAVRTLR